MGYRMTQEQKGLRDSIRNFLEKEVKPHVPEYDEKGETPLELVKKGFDMGLHLIDVPEEYGGLGLGMRAACIVTEEMARIDFGYSSCFNMLALKCVTLMGNEEQKHRACKLVVPGNMCSFCLTEPGAGSDAAAIRTTAVKDGDNYILNGTKCFVTSGAYANLYVVMAVTDPTKGPMGISAFMVEHGTSGLIIGKDENKLGLRLSNTCELIFDNMVIPKENLLGEEGMGFVTAMQGLDTGRITVAAGAVGIAQRALEESIAYSKQRVCFGKAIGKIQSIQFMIADMAKKIEAARLLIDYAATLVDAGADYTKAAAMAKCFATDTVMEVTTDAIQIFGGYGYCKDYPVEKLFRDAKITQIVEGTNQIQRMVIGRSAIADGGSANCFITD